MDITKSYYRGEGNSSIVFSCIEVIEKIILYVKASNRDIAL